MLATCVLVEGLCRLPLRTALRSLNLLGNPWCGLALVTLVLALAVLLTRFWIRVPFRTIGLYGWQRWSSAEKWFFPQILAIALFVFVVMDWATLRSLPDRSGWIGTTLLVFAWQMTWGFYQEYVYRGLLQTDLVGRIGVVRGILAANLLFTFGPLHAYHFWLAAANPSHLWIFAGIFAIGLYFGLLFQRSGNLWIVGVLHGLGDFFIDGLAMMK